MMKNKEKADELSEARIKLNQCQENILSEYKNSVRAIYGSTEQGAPVHIGSCVLIEALGSKFLVTAKHVLDEGERTSLYVDGSSELVLIEGTQYFASCAADVASGKEIKRKDKIDVSVMSLSARMIEELGDVGYIGEEQVYTEQNWPDSKLCTLIGYPNSQNKKVDMVSKNIKKTAFIYSSFLKTDDKLFKSVLASKNDHYLLGFCGKYAKDENGKNTNQIAPKGISGCGLFCTQNIHDLNKLESKLIDIAIEFHKSQKILVFTNIKIVMRLIGESISQNKS